MSNFDGYFNDFKYKETVQRDPTLRDGVYLLAVESIQKSEGFKGVFTHVAFRVLEAAPMKYDSDALLFQDEESYPKHNEVGTVAKLSFDMKDKRQVEKLGNLLVAIDPSFADEKQRPKVLKKLDSADQPYRGFCIEARIGRGISSLKKLVFRNNVFKSSGNLPEDVAATRAELDNTRPS